MKSKLRLRSLLWVVCTVLPILACAPAPEDPVEAAEGAAAGVGTVKLLPTRDVAFLQAVGVPNATQLFQNVDDGVSAVSADDDATYVRSSANTASASYRMGFEGVPGPGWRGLTVHLRAARGSSRTATVQAHLYLGGTQIGTGAVHALGAWASVADTFSDITVPSGAGLELELAVRNTSGVGAPRVTQVWLEGTPALEGDGGTVNGSDPVIVAAGDIACGPNGRVTTGPSCQSAATSNLIFGKPYDAVLLLGDNQYESGKPSDYAAFFAPTWGRFKSLIHPVPGNHDYGTAGAGGYYSFFGTQAGDPARGYYSYDLGTWHIIALNTNRPGTNPADPADCGDVSCKAGSAQERWLAADLAQSHAPCTLVYWHHPRFSSGDHGNNPLTSAFWNDLYAAHADVVLNGHDHDYERLAPVDPAGNADPAHGIREFVVGTGGVDFRGFHAALPSTEARQSDTFGVLELTLHPGSYDWKFIPVAGQTWTDRGTGSCH